METFLKLLNAFSHCGCSNLVLRALCAWHRQTRLISEKVLLSTGCLWQCKFQDVDCMNPECLGNLDLLLA